MFGLDNFYLKAGFALAMIGALILLASPFVGSPSMNLTLLSQVAAFLLVSGAVTYLIGRVVQVRARRAQT